MKTEILTACEQIVAAAANGIYQGILLALLVGVSLRWCGRTNAATRHAIWFATLLLLVSLIPAHLLLGCLGPAAKAGAAPSTASGAAAPAASEIAAAASSAYMVLDSDSGPAAGQIRKPTLVLPDSPQPRGSVAVDAGPASVAPNAEAKVSPPLSEAEIEAELLGSLPAPDSEPADLLAVPTLPAEHGSVESQSLPHESGWRLARFLRPLSWNIAASAGFPRRAGFWLLAVWASAAGLRILFLLWRLCQLRVLKTRARPAAGELDQLFHCLCRKLGVKRQVHLKVSSVQRSPVVLGFFHPAIILPASAGAVDLEEAEHILRHELAHVARHDDWVNLAQHFVQAAVFFHPAVYWISRRLSLEREIACDDSVLEQGGRPRTYALVLANLAGRIQGSAPLLAPGVSTSKSQLQQRITMILNTRRNISPRLAKTRLGFITSVAAVAALLALYAGPRVVLAQTAPVAIAPASPSAGFTASGNPVLVAPRAGAALVSPYVVAQAAPARQPAPDVAPGPKPKPGTSEDETSTAAPEPPAPPMPEVPAQPPAPAVVALTPCPPSPARAPVVTFAAPVANYTPHVFAFGGADSSPRLAKGQPAAKDDSSLEERLERVERMLDSLMAQHNKQNNANGFGYAWKWATPGGAVGPFNSDSFKDSMKQQAERAAEQAKRAAEQAKRAAELSDRAAKQGNDEYAQSQKKHAEHAEGMQKEALQKQMEALRRAKEGLEREMERLDRQMERLEKDQERLDEKQGSIEQDKEDLEENELAGAETAGF